MFLDANTSTSLQTTLAADAYQSRNSVLDSPKIQLVIIYAYISSPWDPLLRNIQHTQDNLSWSLLGESIIPLHHHVL
jgi:hypothetical protein